MSRPTDEHGRPIYRDNETPPADLDTIGWWRGAVVTPGPPTPGNSVSGAHPRPGAIHSIVRPSRCENGWIRSGDWWLHCTDCHPPDMVAYAEQVAVFRMSGDPEYDPILEECYLIETDR